MRSTARPRPKRRLDAVRRPQILAATIELVREKGLSSVRISDVAKRADLSPASVVYYFGTKDQLFAEAITGADDAFYVTVLDELAQRESARQRLAWLIARSSTTDWLLWMDLWVYTLHHPDTAVAQRRFQRRWRQTIQDVIEYGNETAEWRVDDAAAVAQRLSALTDGLAVHMVLGNPDYTRERYVEMTLTAASLELACDLEDLRRAAAACPASGEER
ncbi:MAG TPA: TetR family transcriptional regulator C-terminal domain-containing protein [Solirubrobacteraceae bacterium]